MEIISLKTFIAVVDEGGLKGASDKLNTVQSNITNRIQKLEDELDAKLFHLIGRKLELTPTGRLLYEYAAQILQLEFQAATAIRQSKGSFELRIGTPETFAAVHIPLALKALKQSHPEVRPKIFTATSEQLISALVNNRVDCAVVGVLPANPQLYQIPLVNEELVLVTPLDGDYESVLFVRDEGCGYRRCALNWQQQAGKSGDAMMVMSSADGVLGCIAAGLGYTVIGKNMVVGSRYEKSLRTTTLTTSETSVQISMIYRKDHPLQQGITALAGLFPEGKQQPQSL